MRYRHILTFFAGFLVAFAMPVAAQVSEQFVRYVTRAEVEQMFIEYDRQRVEPIYRILSGGGFSSRSSRSSRSSVRRPVCGNGILESNEQCDDGNKRSNDGCSRTCRREDTIPDPTRCFSSTQCRFDQFCTTEIGECQRVCRDALVPCITVCAGKCAPRALRSSSSSSRRTFDPFALCGNNICESGEGGEFGACLRDCDFSSSAFSIPSTCGNNICERGETEGICSQDCFWSPSNPTPAVCGNNICDVAESGTACDPAVHSDVYCSQQVFCPQDCGFGQGSTVFPPERCDPIRCSDGRNFPRCAPNGRPVTYVIDPCNAAPWNQQ